MEQISHVETDDRVSIKGQWKIFKSDSTMLFSYIARHPPIKVDVDVSFNTDNSSSVNTSQSRLRVPSCRGLVRISDYHRCRSPPSASIWQVDIDTIWHTTGYIQLELPRLEIYLGTRSGLVQRRRIRNSTAFQIYHFHYLALSELAVLSHWLTQFQGYTVYAFSTRCLKWQLLYLRTEFYANYQLVNFIVKTWNTYCDDSLKKKITQEV